MPQGRHYSKTRLTVENAWQLANTWVMRWLSWRRSQTSISSWNSLKSGRHLPHRQGADIDIAGGNRLSDFGQRAWLVERIDLDARHEAGVVGLVEVPAHIDPALRFLVELLQARRLDRIDGDALVLFHDADDTIRRGQPRTR